jgi:hypothetical protein
MGYECIKPDGARPCTSIQVYNPETGKKLKKPIKKYKSVKCGEKVGWVDFCSRKHFKPTDKATEKQHKEDFVAIKAELKAELKKIGAKQLPDNATFAECADCLARLKARKVKVKKEISDKPRRFEEVQDSDSSERVKKAS